MRKTLFVLLFPLFSSCHIPAPHQPYQLTGPLDENERIQVLVLGSEHLSVLGDSFHQSLLNGLLDSLERFGPDLIAVEALPPSEIDRLVRRAADYTRPEAQILAAFAGDAARHGQVAQAVLALSREQAAALADSLLSVRGSLNDAERRWVALHFLAAYDLPTSLLHWSYLPAAHRIADTLIPSSVADFLNQRLNSANELVTIGVMLARRLGLQQMASVDDHSDDEIGVATGLHERLTSELEGSAVFGDLAASAYFEEAQRRLPEAAATGNLLPLYLRINSIDHLNADVAAQWHLFFRTNLESRLDRARAALWEARNLMIAGRIRQATAWHAGGRALVVIGAAHKPFLDQYLAQMMDIDVIHLAEILNEE